MITIGHAPKEMVKKATHGLVDEPWPAQLNKKVWEKRHFDPEKQPHKSLVLSIGQVVSLFCLACSITGDKIQTNYYMEG